MKHIKDKAAYVTKQRQFRSHHCHWPGCKKQVPPAMWGCARHWFKLPKRLRNKIWATYRIGQEKDMRPSRAYLKVADEVQDWIATYLKGKKNESVRRNRSRSKHDRSL